MAIAIVVHERASRAPGLARSRHATLLGNFREDPMVVVIKPILSVVGNVEIFPTVVVVIAYANSLPPAAPSQPCLHRDVSKSSIMIVAVESIAGTLPGRKSFQARAVHQKNIVPAVVVVIEDSHAGSGSFNNVFLGVDSAKDVLHGQPGFFRDVGKVRNRNRRWSRRWRFHLLRA